MQVINSFKVLTNPYKKNQQQKDLNTRFLFGFTGANLAPLKKDTISFSGEQKIEVPPENTFKSAQISEAEKTILARSLGKIIKNEQQCQMVSENARTAENYLKRVLNNRLSSLIHGKQNPDAPIMPIKTRIKTPESVREKIMDALANVIASDKEKFQVYNSEDIKETIGDIVGARVVLRKSQTSETSQIIDKLIEAVNSGELKITNIDNYKPSGENSDLKYFNEEDLQRLEDAVNLRRGPNEPKIKYSSKTKKTGYMALHIDVDLSNSLYQVKNNGYKGEIQIVGYDVEKLKDVEDYCYKIKQGKDIKAGDKAYSAFVEYFNRYINDTSFNENIKEDFLEYTRRAYLFQRKREPIHTIDNRKKDNNYKLPTIADCGMEDSIPPQLDFNTLADIKTKSDDLYNTVNKAKRGE